MVFKSVLYVNISILIYFKQLQNQVEKRKNRFALLLRM